MVDGVMCKEAFSRRSNPVGVVFEEAQSPLPRLDRFDIV
jgi:hypothetical protein